MWGANRTAGGRREPVRSQTRPGFYPSRHELVARVFLQLEQSGVIIRKHGRVVIRDPPGSPGSLSGSRKPLFLRL
jgi:hypothetical protein